MNDDKLISAIKHGSEAAMDEVMTKYARLLWSIASAVLHNVATDEDIEECVADVFVYLWQHPEKYDAQRGKLKAWLSMVTRSQAIDRYRRLVKEHAEALDDAVLIDQLGVCEGIMAQETKAALTEAIQALAQPEQEILIRRYYYEQKPKDIAVALDMSAKQVENHLYRAKLKLRALLDH